ncbi:MAG TPA: recombinase family protein [Clostridia bacterium]
MKTAAYCRYSSDSQREESIDAQLRAIKEYAKKESLDIIKVYIDEARSATTDNRPQFLKMIEDVKKGHYQVVIVHKMDRFARNRYDSAFYKKTLKDNNVKLISVLERFDDSPESILLESLTEGLAEYYSANLARDTMKGLKENAYSCKFNGGKPPFGFSVDKEAGKYIINKPEAEMIKTIFKMYSEGYTYREISDTIVKK